MKPLTKLTLLALTGITLNIEFGILNGFAQCTVVANVSKDTTICKGNTIQLTASGGMFYKWTKGSDTTSIGTTASITVTVDSATTYNVTVSDAFCSVTKSVKVTTGISVSANKQTICKGDSVKLKAKVLKYISNALKFSGGQYVTIANNTNLNNIKTAITVEGWVNINSASDVYNYMVSNDRDCCGGPYRGYSLWVVSGYPLFQVYDTTNASSNYKRAYSSTKISANKWYHIAGTFDGDTVRLYIDGQLSVSTAYKGKIGTLASYNLYLGGMGFGSGSSYSLKGMLDEIRIWNYARTQAEIQSAMNIPINPKTTGLLAYWQFDEGKGTITTDTTGNGYTGTLTGTTWVTSPIATLPQITWSPSTGLNTTTGDSVIAKPTTTTTYIVTKGSCTDSITITVNTKPVAVVTGEDSICKGKSTTLTVSGGTTYLWNTNNDSTAVITRTPVQDTVYTVITTSNCGKDTASIPITVLQVPKASITGKTSVCKGESVTLTASGAITYLWSNGKNTASITESPATNTNYAVTVTNSVSCSDTTSVNVVVNPLPAVDAGKDVSTTKGDSIQLSVGTLPINIGIMSLQWLPTTGLSNSTIAKPFANPSTTTTYIVKVTDANDCSNTDSVIVTVTSETILPQDSCEAMFIPNAFSPNGNNINEALKVRMKGECIKGIDFAIYDRWGKKVFETADMKEATETGWNGKMDDKDLNTGVYAYYVKIKLAKGDDKVQKGNVSLIR